MGVLPALRKLTSKLKNSDLSLFFVKILECPFTAWDHQGRLFGAFLTAMARNDIYI